MTIANNGVKKPKIALLHFSGPPTISGVDVMIRDHARLFRLFNYKVEIVAGSGKQFRKDIPVHIFRRMSAIHPLVQKTRQDLEKGIVSREFKQLEQNLFQTLKRYIEKEEVSVMIIHNIMTRHYNLALTSAIVRLMKIFHHVKFITWVHDTTFYDDPFFKLDRSLSEKYPWNLLVKSFPEMTYVCVSNFLKDNLSRALVKNPPKNIYVIPNGHDIPKFLGLSPLIREFYGLIDGFQSDLIGVIPVRAVPRKKLEFGIEVVRELIHRGVNAKLILTANLDKKRIQNIEYYNFLHTLVEENHLEKNVFFLEAFFQERHSKGGNARIPMPEVYLMSDFLLLTSTVEGFGLPLLEAGLIRCPIFARDIPVFREIGTTNINYFSIDAKAEKVADLIQKTMQTLPQAYFYRKIINNYSLHGIFKKQVIPLIETLHNTTW